MAKKRKKYTMSPQAIRQRHNAPLKHGRRSPVLMSLGKKFGCTKPDQHENEGGTPGEFDPENCEFCRARWTHLLEVRTLLGSTDANVMERAATTRIHLENMEKELTESGTNPLRDKDYIKGLELDLKILDKITALTKGNTVNVVHHKAQEEDEDDVMVIDVSRVENT